MNVVSPLGVTIKLGKFCKDCPLTLEDRNFLMYLKVLSLSEFDIILGINWLTKYGAILDCVSKSITFTMPKELSFKFQCEPTSNVFLTTRLAEIESTRADNTFANIIIIQDFEDVFRNISGFPPEQRDRFLYRFGTLNLSIF